MYRTGSNGADIRKTSRASMKRKKHFQDRLAPSTEGNLFKPMTEYHMVSGGWRIANHNRRLHQ